MFSLFRIREHLHPLHSADTRIRSGTIEKEPSAAFAQQMVLVVFMSSSVHLFISL